MSEETGSIARPGQTTDFVTRTLFPSLLLSYSLTL